MKYLFLFLSFLAFANDTKVDEKIYTQAELDQKVVEEVKKKIEEIKVKSVAELTKELLDKEQQLRDRELQIKREEERLNLTKSDLKKLAAKFEDDKKSFLGCIDKNKSEVNARLNRMVEVVSNMKPQKASDLLSSQESEISVRILSELDPVKASKIFNLMEKEISARLQKQYLHMKK